MQRSIFTSKIGELLNLKSEAYKHLGLQGLCDSVVEKDPKQTAVP